MTSCLIPRVTPSAKEPESAIAGRSSKGYFDRILRTIPSAGGRRGKPIGRPGRSARRIGPIVHPYQDEKELSAVIEIADTSIRHPTCGWGSQSSVEKRRQHIHPAPGTPARCGLRQRQAVRQVEARDAIGRVEAAFRDWELVSITPIAQVFLSLLLLGDRWNR